MAVGLWMTIRNVNSARRAASPQSCMARKLFFRRPPPAPPYLLHPAATSPLYVYVTIFSDLGVGAPQKVCASNVPRDAAVGRRASGPGH